MTRFQQSLCWALALMALALAAVFDLVPERFAQTTIPLLAVLSAVTVNGRRCRFLTRGKAA